MPAGQISTRPMAHAQEPQFIFFDVVAQKNGFQRFRRTSSIELSRSNEAHKYGVVSGSAEGVITKSDLSE